MNKIEILPNVTDDSRRGTQHELDRGVYLRIKDLLGSAAGAAMSVGEARALADGLNDLADEIQRRFDEAEHSRRRHLGLKKGAIIRLKTGPVLVLDDLSHSRPFRVVANGNFVPGASGPCEYAKAPRWPADSIKEVGYEVLVHQ